MHIVINIPEESYEFAKDCKSKGSSKHSWNLSHDNIVLMIANGTPLPEGHGELKDADVMINKLCTQEASELFGSTTCAEILDFINDEKPIVEADKSER